MTTEVVTLDKRVYPLRQTVPEPYRNWTLQPRALVTVQSDNSMTRAANEGSIFIANLLLEDAFIYWLADLQVAVRSGDNDQEQFWYNGQAMRATTWPYYDGDSQTEFTLKRGQFATSGNAQGTTGALTAVWRVEQEPWESIFLSRVDSHGAAFGNQQLTIQLRAPSRDKVIVDRILTTIRLLTFDRGQLDNAPVWSPVRIRQ